MVSICINARYGICREYMMCVAAESHTVASSCVQLSHHFSVRQTESSRCFGSPAAFAHCYRRRHGIRDIFKNNIALFRLRAFLRHVLCKVVLYTTTLQRSGSYHAPCVAKGNMYPRAAFAVTGLKTDSLQAQQYHTSR